MNYYEIVKKLIGEIEPIGESNADKRYYKNLIETIDLVERLTEEIILVARHKERHESSISYAGRRADMFITNLKQTVNPIKH